MRPIFFQTLHELMKDNPDIYALTGDLGYGGFNFIERDYPNRFMNCGASEQAMLDIAVGLAYEGKIPFVYSITPFLLYRPFETLRTYIDHEKLNVKLIGSGRDDNYKHDGYSHDATDAKPILDTLENIKQYWPETVQEVKDMTREMASHSSPSFISLTR